MAEFPVDRHDERLLELVAPRRWRNPRPARSYDLVVVGAGTAGLVAAAGAAALGARVALIERDRLGGDCLNTGCVPSKALLRAARAAHDVRAADGFGVRCPGVATVDFAAIMERMRRLRSEIAVHDSVTRFQGLGVDVFLGGARFTARDRIELVPADAASVEIRFRRAIVATGSRPAVPDIPGLGKAGFLTSETVWNLTELPPRLAVLGAGPVGCELAQAFARFGARVALLESEPRILTADDPDAAAVVADALRRDGVELVTGRSIEGVEMTAGGALLHIGHRGPIEVDRILVAAGRLPNVEGLDLEAAGVEHGPGGVEVDDGLRTTNRRVWAAGDICTRLRFTHVADAHARIAIRNALFPGRGKLDVRTVPWCTFTDPELAQVGHTVESAARLGVRVRSFTQPFDTVDRAVLDGETVGFARILVRGRSDEIVGATVVGRHAGELIAEVAVAMAADLGLAALAGVVHAYPTRAEALRKLGDAYQRTRLTPRARWLLGRWLEFSRLTAMR